MSEGGGWVKWVGMQGYTVSHTVQNESTITFLGGCRWRESSPAHSPVRLQPKNAYRIAQACNRLPASSFWLVIDVQDRLGLICLRNRWTVIHL